MALIKCPECGNMISDNSINCPKCGYPIGKTGKQEQKNETKNNLYDDHAVMNPIKGFFYKLINTIDDKRFLIKPLKWLYYLKGVIPFAFPMLFILAMFSSSPFYYSSTWKEIVTWFFVILFTLYLFFIAYINSLFWFKRAKQLETIVRPGDSIVAISLVADSIKNNGESFAILLSTIAIVGAVLYFLCILFTGPDEYFKHLLFGFLVVIGVIVLCPIISYIIIFFTHFIAEKLRMRAQMCNDLRDVADIYRAANTEKDVH